MNKPLPGPMSAPVRSRPILSIEERRGEEKNPPVPPQAMALAADPIPLEVRRLRVANGSRRKRDLAAVRMAEELELLERVGQTDARAAGCWRVALQRLRASVPEPTYRLWLEPLQPITTDAGTLILTAPENVRTWTERRYAGLIREALEGTGFSDVAFVSAGGDA